MKTTRTTSRAARIPRQVGEHAKEQFAEEADDAGDDHRDHHQLHVAVADMCVFVAEHGLDLLVVQRLQQACRDRDGVLPPVEAGAKAFSAGPSITFSFGIGMPREMQRFSRRL